MRGQGVAQGNVLATKEMMAPEVTKILAEWLARVQWRDVPLDIRREARLSLADYLGCALLGSTREHAAGLCALVNELGGKPQATLVGTGRKSSVCHAALVNGIFGSASWLLEDTALESFAHPGVNVVPAALAVAEFTDATGADLLLAIVLGYEVAMRIGAACGWRTFGKGWHPRGTFNVFGAAVAAGKLLGLSSGSQFCAALGLAGTQASGLVESSAPYDGWLLLSGSAAQDGVLAALLASHGWSAGCTVIEGTRGYLQAVAATPRPERSVEDLGKKFEISSITRKRHASSSLTHSAIDLMIELKLQHSLSHDMIESIEVRTIDVHYLLEKRWPQSRLEGAHSLPYLLAVAFLDEEIFDPQFSSAYLQNPLIKAMFDLITVVVDDSLTSRVPYEFPAHIIVRMKNGRTVDGYRAYPKGDPREPLLEEDLHEKFRRLAGCVLSQSQLDSLWKWIKNAENELNVKDLTHLLAPERTTQ